MGEKKMPLTLRRHQCIEDICAAINRAGLPAFVVVEILDRFTAEMQKQTEIEYNRDLRAYQEGDGIGTKQNVENETCEIGNNPE